MEPTSGAEIGLVALRFGRERGRIPPLGLLSLAGSLRRHGIGWTLEDAPLQSNIGPFSVDGFVELMRGIEAPSWGLGVFNDALPLVAVGLRKLQDDRPRRIFVGGPGTLGVAEALLARAPSVEAVVIGEAEAVFPALLRAQPGACTLPGVVARTAPLRLRAPQAPVRLDELPAPAWDWCRGRPYRVVPLSTMRGCPFACQFCEVEALMGRRVRKTDVEVALDQLDEALRAIPTRHVQILDDALTVAKPHLLALCRGLTARRWPVTFEIFARPHTLDDEMLEALAAAGCRRVYLGIDAGDDELLARVTRGLTVADAVAAARRVAGHMEAVVSTMWGYPFESLAQFTSTLALCRRLRALPTRHPVRTELHLIQPSVATPLFRQHESALVLREEVASQARGRDEREVLQLIVDDRRLGAAFYRFENEDYREKCRRLEAFGRDSCAERIYDPVTHEPARPGGS